MTTEFSVIWLTSSGVNGRSSWSSWVARIFTSGGMKVSTDSGTGKPGVPAGSARHFPKVLYLLSSIG